jgi:hypothetical protein
MAGYLLRFAEKGGFEPPDPCRSTVFKTAAIDHSATSPLGLQKYKKKQHYKTYDESFQEI